MATSDEPPRLAIAPIVTDRLRVRVLMAGDVDAVFGILGDRRTTAQVSWGQASRDRAEAWLRRRQRDEARYGCSMWAVETGSELVGLCGFFPSGEPQLELGYVIHADRWGRGYATEAATAAVAAATSAGFGVVATIRPENLASRRVAERAGLRHDGATTDERGVLLVYRLPPPHQ